MNYKTATQHLSNVTIQSYSPRAIGEQEKNSEWKDAFPLSTEYKQRVQLIEHVSKFSQAVVVRPATYGGRMRIWVKGYNYRGLK